MRALSCNNLAKLCFTLENRETLTVPSSASGEQGPSPNRSMTTAKITQDCGLCEGR